MQNKVIIQPRKNFLALPIKELIAYKDLFWVLALRDIKVKYAQTYLGIVWTILQPISTLVILVLIFGVAVKVDTGNIPYPLFTICGMSAWSYFSSVLSQSGNSIISQQNMIKKIYFPRMIIPLSKAVSGFIDFGVTLIFIFALMIYYQFIPPSQIVFLPLFFGLNILLALSVGIWLSALTVRFRDFQHIIPFIVQLGLYATPVAYPSHLIPEKYRAIYFINPMVGVIEGFRWTLINGTPPNSYSFISFGIIILLFISSLFYFNKVEENMADIV